MRLRAGDPVRLRAIAACADRPRGDGSRWLSEQESKDLLRAAGIAVVEGRLVVSSDDAAAALAQWGAPIAMKLSAPSVRHKSEIGGVALDLCDEAGVRAAYGRLASLAAQHGGDVLAERMAGPGVELLVAARTDAIVPALVLGLGGIWTELLDDVAIVPLPASAARIGQALMSLRGAPVLTGGRGRSAVDLGAACELAEHVGELLIARSLALIELNPVVVNASGAVVADATVLEGVAPSCTT
jgi:succinyl-CoA synthetase beta subunit